MLYPCNICNKKVITNAICCDACNSWVHKKCAGLSNIQLHELSQSDDLWFCNMCYKEIFPCHDLNNEEFLAFVNGYNGINVELYLDCKKLNKNVEYNERLIEDDLEFTDSFFI